MVEQVIVALQRQCRVLMVKSPVRTPKTVTVMRRLEHVADRIQHCPLHGNRPQYGGLLIPKPRDFRSRCYPTSELVPGFSSSVVIHGGDESDGFTNSLVEKISGYINSCAKNHHFRHRIPTPQNHGKGAVAEQPTRCRSNRTRKWLCRRSYTNTPSRQRQRTQTAGPQP
jgi:hypothetical protein